MLTSLAPPPDARHPHKLFTTVAARASQEGTILPMISERGPETKKGKHTVFLHACNIFNLLPCGIRRMRMVMGDTRSSTFMAACVVECLIRSLGVRASVLNGQLPRLDALLRLFRVSGKKGGPRSASVPLLGGTNSPDLRGAVALLCGLSSWTFVCLSRNAWLLTWLHLRLDLRVRPSVHWCREVTSRCQDATEEGCWTHRCASEI